MSQQITIPATSLKQLADLLEEASRVARGLSEGKPSNFLPTIPELKRPRRIPTDEEWFWADEWQSDEHEVNNALANGEYRVFDSMKDLIADLHHSI